ncbi:Spc7-domain-containing protein [Delitschia confertaspora ATCC 74209]|uniref:Spc7-domain-containing protein n=1 Tax=Delitschia confertaspora ATCC 74209 TaxID=1513339 RepID=A0A9P4MU04_9PLEO|nr:Spc7-domain-containing protein [Delitschia confertaspora ATCC 74209]
MASDLNKENIADGLVAGSSFSKAPALSPRKSGRKTRSKSIGPGGLGSLEEAPLKESAGNRRKSAFIPAVKSILASNDEDEKKRRDERRKSLARRRVSFAPEATLHTWDVVEYLRDATTSSASSEASRRASSMSQASTRTSPALDSDAEEPPSTPPEQIEEPLPGSSPAKQRDLHQKKFRRRSSGIPPMNFNNPEDIYSSSPLGGNSSSPVKDDGLDHVSDEESDVTIKQNHSNESSTRLDAALQQAAAYAGTHGLDLDEDGDMSMELAEEEITAAFKPWAKKTLFQESMDLFSPLSTAKIGSGMANGVDGLADENDGDEDMSMDITRAIGRIVPQPQDQGSGQEDATMDLTMPLGSIQMTKNLKRRRSSLLEASQGSPAKRSGSRRSSLRQQPPPGEGDILDEETMDLTVAIGAIKGKLVSNEQDRRRSVDTSFGDETMDFTVAMGGIKTGPTVTNNMGTVDDEDAEELSMELTRAIGDIKTFGQQAATTGKPTTVKAETPVIAKTTTPRKSPAKSPGRLKMADLQTHIPSPSTRKGVHTTPQKSPGQPRNSIIPATPEVQPAPQQRIEDFEPSPFVRQNANKKIESTSTPPNQVEYPELRAIPDDPVAAPILNRRRSSLSSVQFSPLAASRENPPLKSTAVLSNNIKLLSTPRKQALASPVKRGITPKKALTPKKTPTPKKATPRKSLSPKKRVVFGEDQQEAEPISEVPDAGEDEVERISLQEFLDMTNIRFMDLTTTKRRHTAAPSSFHDNEVEEREETLDRYVVAAACTLPEYELYQHACHEMKKFISDGRNFVRTIEANVLEENPLLFSEYLTAPPDQRSIMDNQFKNLKTNARLAARGEWYSWRSRLLQDLKAGLLGTMEGFRQDEYVLAEQERLLDTVLPSLTEQNKQLETQCKKLQQRHDELNSCDLAELESAREQLTAADAEIEEKRRLVASLQAELVEKESRIEAIKDRKVECLEEIKAAERVREDCRGWSVSEVNGLKAKVAALEEAHGWSIISATSTTITMTHLNDLELYFHPSAFATGDKSPNGSISLTYVGDSATPHPRPLTTSKRFFLQLLRAHLHCIPQSQTRISELLSVVKNGWAAALAVAEGVHWLEHSYITEETILSDERMAISSYMLLHTLQTKVKVTFEIGVSLGAQGMETQVVPKAEVVYGEKYREDRMADFLKQFVGEEVKREEEMGVWENAVVDLAERLRARGKKGERC